MSHEAAAAPLSRHHYTARWIAETAAFAGLYVLAGKTGLQLAYLHPSASPVWPPTGIAIAGLLLLGTRAWPGVFVGAFVTNDTTLGTIWTSLGIATGNTLEAVVAVTLVNRYAGGRRAFDRLDDIVRFAIVAAALSTAISATLGVLSLDLGGFASPRIAGPMWLTWWLGDACGALLVTPLLLLWADTPRLGWTLSGAVDRLIFIAVLLATSGVVFGSRFPFGFAIVPFLIWAGFRFGPRDAVTAVTLVAAISVWGTIHRLGPFASVTPERNEALVYLSLFIGMMTIITLTVARIVAERAGAAEELRRRVLTEEDARRTAERAVGRATRLAAMTAALSESVTPAEVAAVIVAQAVDALGARAAALSLLATDGVVLELVHATGYPADVVARWNRFLPDQFGGIGECMRTGRVVLLESEADLAGHYPAREELPETIRHGARAAVPLLTRGSALGVLYMNFGAPRSFDGDEMTFILTLAHQCAQAVERARLYEREHRVAETFQRALLPVAIPQVPGLAVDAVYQPGAHESDVGGDWYDVFRLPSGGLAVSIGDVAGRGLAAAVVMAELRQTIRAAALDQGDPAGVLTQASQALALAHGRDAMATAIVGIFDPVTSAFSYATAGHPGPVLAAPGEDPRILPTGGVPLGYLHMQSVPSWTVRLPQGALLVLYTDGLIEHSRDVVAGQDAVVLAAQREMMAPSGDRPGAILRRVVGDRQSGDDAAVITLALDPSPFSRFKLTLPAEPASAGLIRQTVRRLARVAGLNETRTVALTIAVGEAVNNVIEHAYRGADGAVRVEGAHEGDAVRVSIGDTGSWRPARAPDGGGHGLRLIEALADSVEMDRTSAGTTVAVTVRRGGARAPAVTSGAGAAGSTPAPAPDDADPTLTRGRERAVAGADEPTAGARVHRVAQLPVVETFGDLDDTCLEFVRQAFQEAARDNSAAVIVSLEHVRYIDSHTIRALFALGRDLSTQRRSLALVVPPGSALERIVSIAGLSTQFRAFPSVADALAAVAASPPAGL
ncbi:MAG TPA: MASE1 domain-containing protein [bacterium]|nr:MASE1 domain-containing protein [bacterium]